MTIYDRYNGDPSAERRRQHERLRKAKRGLREDYEQAGKLAWSLFAAFLLLAVVLLLQDDPPDWMYILLVAPFLGFAFVGIRWESGGDARKYDLYIYGMEDGAFLLLNPLYEVLKRISPAEICEIRIFAAMRPTTRQRVVPTKGLEKDTTGYEPWGVPREADGEEKVDAYPMAVLHTGDTEADWRYMHDPICRRLLNDVLSIVPMGENAMPFAWALRQSGCPVVVERETYEAHRELLDELFALSGMDMGRLRISRKEEWDAGL